MKSNLCSGEIFEALEEFTVNMGSTNEAILTLGATYLNCQKYDLARKKFDEIIDLKNSNSDNTLSLVAEYGLVIVDFETKQIKEDEYEKKILEIGNKIKEKTNIAKQTALQCNCTRGSFGGTLLFGICIVPCP